MDTPGLKGLASKAWDDAETDGLTFVQIRCSRVNTHRSVTAVLDAFGAATRGPGQGPVAISYLVHCAADVSVANERYREIIRTYSDGGNRLSFMTFGSWGGSADRQVVVLDADEATTSSTDTLVMLRITQELEDRAKSGGVQCLVVALTNSPAAPVWRAGAVSAPRKVTLKGPMVHETEHDGEDWSKILFSTLLGRLRTRLEVLGDEEAHLQHMAGEESGPSIVLFMDYEDAWELFGRLRRECQGVEFGCITPWSGQSDINHAIGPSRCLKLIHIDDGVRMAPLVQNAEVFVGPGRRQFLFNWGLGVAVGYPRAIGGNIGPRLQVASSLSEDPAAAVHTFGREQEDDAKGWEHVLELASGVQLMHLQLGLIAACNGSHPIDLPIKFPADDLMLVEAVRRLGAWGLADHDETVLQQPVVRHPLGVQTARFLRSTPNINSAVMLGCIGNGVSDAVASVLVDMAVMVCQGPRSVFHTATREAKVQVMRQMGSLGGPFVKLIHKGQLWLSVACLDLFRRGRMPDQLAPLLRSEVLLCALNRTAEIKSDIGIGAVDGEQELTGPDVAVVEEQLARAFVFNILLAGSPKGYSAVDFISCERLERPAEDTLDWDILGRESDRPGVVAGVYTCLDACRTSDPEQPLGIQPCDVTIVSIGAVWKALLGVPDREHLRPSAARGDGRDEVERYLGSPDSAGQVEVAGGAAGQGAPVGPPAPPAAAATQDSGVGIVEQYFGTNDMRAVTEGGFELAD